MALRLPHIALTLAVLTAAAPAPVLAQSSNSDLIGSRAAGAETELQARAIGRVTAGRGAMTAAMCSGGAAMTASRS